MTILREALLFSGHYQYHTLGAQSWTALFVAVSSHRQPSASLIKGIHSPAGPTFWPKWTNLNGLLKWKSFWFRRSQPRRTSNFSVMFSVVTQRGTFVIRIAYGCPYYTGPAIFYYFFWSSTSEKSFIPYKPSATLQAIKVCQFRPRGWSSWGIPLIRETEDCRWELKARNRAVQLCASYDSRCFTASGLVVDLAT